MWNVTLINNLIFMHHVSTSPPRSDNACSLTVISRLANISSSDIAIVITRRFIHLLYECTQQLYVTYPRDMIL